MSEVRGSERYVLVGIAVSTFVETVSYRAPRQTHCSVYIVILSIPVLRCGFSKTFQGGTLYEGRTESHE